MSLTVREFITAMHGMIFGALFLLAFSGGLAELFSLRKGQLTPAGLAARVLRLKWGTTLMAIASWATVISGTWVVYPWYRAVPPEGANLADYPRYFLLDNPTLAGWHTFGMEWKEHVAWFSPILAVVAAFLIFRYGQTLAENARLRRIVTVFFVGAFITAAIAGLLGAFITKAAPIL